MMHFRYGLLTLGWAVASFAGFANGAVRACDNQVFDCGGKTHSISRERKPETGPARLWMGSEQFPYTLAMSTMPIAMQGNGDIGDGGVRLISDRPMPVDSNGGIGNGAGPIPVDGDGGIGGGAGPIGSDRPMPVESDGGIGGGVRTVLNIAGRSLGGRLREGPGTGFRPVGSLAEGTAITIIANSGVSFNGFDWFEISLRNGKTAYQWGGILCPKGQTVPGIYQKCI